MAKKSADHFKALKEMNPDVQRLLIFDYDDESSFHPDAGNQTLKEWKRRNIENYLLVPDAWKAAVLDSLNEVRFDLYNNFYQEIIEDFFVEQNLQLPLGFDWTNLKANIFATVNGKKILFEDKDSLFNRILNKGLNVNREKIALNMNPDMIHEDIKQFFNHIAATAEHPPAIY